MEQNLYAINPLYKLGIYPHENVFFGASTKGVISAVTGFGLFVALDDIFAEGLIHVTDLPEKARLEEGKKKSAKKRKPAKKPKGKTPVKSQPPLLHPLLHNQLPVGQERKGRVNPVRPNDQVRDALCCLLLHH
ncbi:S1 RNA-binding domain-containing protein [Endozoicomonas euniceicola]|uniref:S1 RNA-binding domain-containing protein n=1 Tax=Endozoicomonas euniceicola TaxID=1234143 RepID=A0ABY6GY38_9GAMM|nr:S1 RNA-binding domain-containing protein [Endozoicomonas euniceicola]UYM17706.1 S1 RNA-binding domain-containing protein [Endozoicomonas euniceicola]